MKKYAWIGAGALLLLATLLYFAGTKLQNDKSGSESMLEPLGNRAATAPSKDSAGTLVNNEPNVEDISITDTKKQSRGEPVLSDAVKALLGLDEKKHNYQTLLAAIDELDYELSQDDIEALMEMLKYPNSRFPEKMRPIEINAVKNDVLDKLLRQKRLPEMIGFQLAEMAENEENDPVWRDYCVQFMQPFYERASTERKEHGAESVSQASGLQNAGNTDALQVIHGAMFQALDERNTTIAGTSLIGLELLSRTHEEFDREIIINKANEIAADETASASSRMTGLRLASQVAQKQGAGTAETTADTARLLAQTGETVLLRSAAIVTLGEIGTPEDRELLQAYQLADNKQIASAATMALEKMDAKN